MLTRSDTRFIASCWLVLFWADVVSAQIINVESQSGRWKDSVVYGWFDPSAPTVTYEDILAHKAQRKAFMEQRALDSDRKRQESLRRTQACYDSPPSALPQSAAQKAQAPGSAAPSASRQDLEGMSLQELQRRYVETKDPAVLAEMQRRSPHAGIGRAPDTTGQDTLRQLGSVPGLDPAMAEQMRRAGRAAEPGMQACLDEAERIGSAPQPEFPTGFLDLNDAHIGYLRSGRTDTLVITIATDSMKPEYMHEYKNLFGEPYWLGQLRFNVVRASGAHGTSAVPMATALARTSALRAKVWPLPPQEYVDRSWQIQNMRDPEAPPPKKKEPWIRGMENPVQKLKDALKGVPR